MANENTLRSDFIRSLFLLISFKPVEEIDINSDKAQLILQHPSFYDHLAYIIYTNEAIDTIDDISMRFYSVYPDCCRGEWPHMYYKNHILIINRKQIGTIEFLDALKDLCSNFTPNSKRANVIKMANSKSYEEHLSTLNKLSDSSKASNVNNFRLQLNSNIDSKIEDTSNEISAHLIKIQELKEYIRQLYANKLSEILKASDDNPISKLYKYLPKCKLVQSYNIMVSNSSVQFVINLKPYPLAYTYGDSALSKLINNSSRFNKCERKDILMDALGNRINYDIYLLPITIEIDVKVTGEVTWSANQRDTFYRDVIKSFAPNLQNRSLLFRNRHYFSHNCLGSFAADLAEAALNTDLVRLFATLLQYMSTINITDGAGNAWMEQPHIVKEKATNQFFILNPKIDNNHKEEIIPLSEPVMELLSNPRTSSFHNISLDKYLSEKEPTENES